MRARSATNASIHTLTHTHTRIATHMHTETVIRFAFR